MSPILDVALQRRGAHIRYDVFVARPIDATICCERPAAVGLRRNASETDTALMPRHFDALHSLCSADMPGVEGDTYRHMLATFPLKGRFIGRLSKPQSEGI